MVLLLLCKWRSQNSETGSDLQEAMQVWGKDKVEVRGLESMSRILPPHQEVLALSKGWPCLKAEGLKKQKRESGWGCRRRPGHLSWAKPGVRPVPQAAPVSGRMLQTAKNKIRSGISSEEETETEKTEPQP